MQSKRKELESLEVDDDLGLDLLRKKLKQDAREAYEKDSKTLKSTGATSIGTDEMPFGYYYIKNDHSREVLQYKYEAGGRETLNLIPIDNLPEVDSTMSLKPNEAKFYLVKWDHNGTIPGKKLKLPFTDVTAPKEDPLNKLLDAELNDQQRRQTMVPGVHEQIPLLNAGSKSKSVGPTHDPLSQTNGTTQVKVEDVRIKEGE